MRAFSLAENNPVPARRTGSTGRIVMLMKLELPYNTVAGRPAGVYSRRRRR